MSRRHIVTPKQIQEQRANAWQMHYQLRERAKIMIESGWDGVQISYLLSLDLPAPELDVDGYPLRVPISIRREKFDRLLSSLRVATTDLLCIWYWTSGSWQDFVRLYQSLPDIYEDYYYLVDIEADRLRLAPVSSKPKQGSGIKVHLPYLAVKRSG